MSSTAPVRRVLSAASAFLFVSCLAGQSNADTLEVPGEYATITAAISAASGGDVVQIAAGTYVERINSA